MKHASHNVSISVLFLLMTTVSCGASTFSGVSAGTSSALTSAPTGKNGEAADPTSQVLRSSTISPSGTSEDLTGTNPTLGSGADPQTGSDQNPTLGGQGGQGSQSVEPTCVSVNGAAINKGACEERKKLRSGVKKCLAAWGAGTPFTESSPYRNLGVAVSVLGFGSSLNDSEATDKPELVVIPASVSVLTITKYRLLNPNGWYCMVADVSVGAIINVDLNKNAHLADSRADVRVLAVGSNGPAMVDVHVISSVKVRRVP
ncbi:MAG: hypothetical protein NTY08_14180 [Proteobacteria bacterium]|nr:hypothetical protein [Pseudomonadota bacterium]